MKTILFDFFDKIIFFLLFIQVAVLNYLNLSNIGIKVICFLILVRLVLEILLVGKIKISILKSMVWILIIFVIGYFSAKLGHEYHRDIFISNFLSILYVIITLVYVSYIINYRYYFVLQILNSSIWIMNLYFVFNMIVSCIQIQVEGFMSGISTWINPMHEDLICGLMGYSATPQFGLFSIFIIILNLYYSDFCNSNYIRNYVYRIYSIILIAFVIVISSFNDNKMVYIELPLALLFYLYLTGRLNFMKKKIERKNFNLVMMIFVGTIMGIFLYLTVPIIRDDIYMNFIYAVELLIEATTSNSILGYGSADRLYMVIYAFDKYNALKLGYGMGAFPWHTDDVLGFRHFGQADLGAFLCLGGLLFTVVVFMVWMNYYIKIIYSGKTSKSRLGYVLLYVVSLLLLFYTQLISINTVSIIVIFCGIVLGVANREMSKKKINDL